MLDNAIQGKHEQEMIGLLRSVKDMRAIKPHQIAKIRLLRQYREFDTQLVEKLMKRAATSDQKAEAIHAGMPGLKKRLLTIMKNAGYEGYEGKEGLKAYMRGIVYPILSGWSPGFNELPEHTQYVLTWGIADRVSRMTDAQGNASK